MTAKAKKMQESFELKSTPNVYYEKFFAKFGEIKTLEPSKWKSVHLIAHFCSKYETLYQVKYTFKFNKSPSKCYEVIQLNRAAAMLNTEDPVVLKDYIDWIFANKIGTAQRRITVIGFIATQAFADEYKRTMKRAETPTRAAILPVKYAEVLDAHKIQNCATYGGLAFMWMAHQADPDAKYENLFQDLAGLGLNPAIFETMK